MGPLVYGLLHFVENGNAFFSDQFIDWYVEFIPRQNIGLLQAKSNGDLWDKGIDLRKEAIVESGVIADSITLFVKKDTWCYY